MLSWHTIQSNIAPKTYYRAISKSHESIGEKGEKLKQKTLQGIGNKAIINGEEVKVGAGGYLGGVRLAVSDESVREKNNRMLKAFLKKEAKKRKKQLRKSEECQDGNSIESWFDSMPTKKSIYMVL